MPTKFPNRALLIQLGKKSDASIAREHGLTRQRVSEIRKEKRIPVFKPEFAADNKVTFCTNLTKKDEREMTRAMKKIGTKSKSEYGRKAVRKMNKEVLEG